MIDRPRWKVREYPVGGVVAPALREDAPGLMDGRRRIIVLIHGYNTPEDDARESYAQFIGNLADIDGAETVILPHIVEFYWPGDSWSKVTSTLGYASALGRAVESAKRLSEFVTNRLVAPADGPCEFILIAHSLGNRVALEFVKAMLAIGQRSRAPMRACLLAAAVPVFSVEDRGKLRTASGSVEALTLYSPQDAVLTWAFPAGQLSANDGWLPEAVGLYGLPTERWRALQRMHEWGSGFGHDDYWKSPKTARAVASFLGIAGPREIEPGIVSKRALPPPPSLDETPFPPRQTKSRPTFG